ncbi:hypothetical protein, partial [Fulvivirga marina]|uniref:hypothetical protein n=1 Tax=Fulvivirga marina TaxID=2494733 RepID=UPI001EE2BEC5
MKGKSLDNILSFLVILKAFSLQKNVCKPTSQSRRGVPDHGAAKVFCPASLKGEVKVDAGGTKADILNVAASPKEASQEEVPTR